MSPAWLGRRLGSLLGRPEASASPALAVPYADQPWDEVPLTVFDLETSGLDPARHHIVQVGAVQIRAGGIRLGQAWSGVCLQQAGGSAASRLIHEITPASQRQGRPVAEVLGDFARYGTDSLLLAYDAPFDLGFLDKAWVEAGLSVPRPFCLDVAELAACLLPDWQGRRQGLDSCLRHCGLPVVDRHEALGDALLTAQLVQILIRRAQQKGFDTPGRLLKELADWRRVAALKAH